MMYQNKTKHSHLISLSSGAALLDAPIWLIIDGLLTSESLNLRCRYTNPMFPDCFYLFQPLELSANDVGFSH